MENAQINYEALERFLKYLKTNNICFSSLIRDTASDGGIKFLNEDIQNMWQQKINSDF